MYMGRIDSSPGSGCLCFAVEGLHSQQAGFWQHEDGKKVSQAQVVPRDAEA